MRRNVKSDYEEAIVTSGDTKNLDAATRSQEKRVHELMSDAMRNRKLSELSSQRTSTGNQCK